jgi:hypothetical protein
MFKVHFHKLGALVTTAEHDTREEAEANLWHGMYHRVEIVRPSEETPRRLR